MVSNSSQLSALSRLFSSAVFREMAENGSSAKFARLFGLAAIRSETARRATVADGFDAAFSVLKHAGCRDEYVYRAALTQKILMGKHSLNTACMLTEFRAGACKADLVILNGSATVYEIKSERDSLARLVNQISNYQKVFAAVNVIASTRHIDGILNVVSDDVGVLCLSDRYHIQVVRDAVDQPERVSPVAILESLRSSEALAVLGQLGASIQKVQNTKLRTMLRTEFAKQKPAAVHEAMVATLKRTRNLAPLRILIEQLPPSLHAAALSIQLQPNEHDRLVAAISTPLHKAT